MRRRPCRPCQVQQSDINEKVKRTREARRGRIIIRSVAEPEFTRIGSVQGPTGGLVRCLPVGPSRLRGKQRRKKADFQRLHHRGGRTLEGNEFERNEVKLKICTLRAGQVEVVDGLMEIVI